MKTTTKLSLALNALLAGCVFWLAGAGARSEAGANLTNFTANHMLFVKPKSTPPANEPSPEVVEIAGPFQWSQLESDDYQVYLANLRGIGCPEATVRDIVIADVNEVFTTRVKALVDEVSGQFWHYLTHENELDELINEKGKQVWGLDQQRSELFATLFGNENPRAEEAQRARDADNCEQWERVADFLPPEKQARFAAAKDELERAWMVVLRTPDLTNAERQEKRKALDGAHEQALRAWLTPGEYDELRLRQSPAAGLRDRLVGLDLDEASVRAAAEIQCATDAARAALSSKDADFQARTAQLRQQAEAQTRELLGTDGCAAFQRAADPRYEPIYRVAQRLELPDETAAQAFDIRRQAEEAANRLRNDKALAAEDRQARLQAIGAETQQSLTTALGAKAFAAYEKVDGGWMQQMMAARQ